MGNLRNIPAPLVLLVACVTSGLERPAQLVVVIWIIVLMSHGGVQISLGGSQRS